MKKAISIVCVCLMLAALLVGCGGSSNGATAGGETRTVTDALGRQVEIPKTVNRIVPLGNTPRMISYLGLADKVVGIGSCEQAKSPIQAYAYVNKDKWKGLPDVGTDSGGDTAYFAEEIISVQPDVILCTYPEDTVNDIAAQTGLPVISVDQGTLFGEDYEKSLRILGEVCGVESRAQEVISYINATVEDLNERTKNIPEDQKRSVLGAAATFKGGHGIEGVYNRYQIFSALNAKDVTAEVGGQTGSSGVVVDKEKILQWNPDIIFFDSSNLNLVNDDYKTNPNYYASLQAVNDGELYAYPNSTWHWVNVDISLVNCYYVGSILYPEQFSDIRFEDKANEVFTKLLSADRFFHELKGQSNAYQKVTLGGA